MRPKWDELWMDVARTVALRSLCDRDQVGAVIVSATNRIIDTGYNGPPAGFHVPGPPHEMCTAWCPRAQAGTANDEMIQEALKEAQIVPSMKLPLHTLSLDYVDCPALHAEANALMFSDRLLREGGTIYVSSGTCSGCAKLVANSGLVRAVYAPSQREDGAAHRDSEQWYKFLRDCGIVVDTI